jgi:hypothetical protein
LAIPHLLDVFLPISPFLSHHQKIDIMRHVLISTSVRVAGTYLIRINCCYFECLVCSLTRIGATGRWITAIASLNVRKTSRRRQFSLRRKPAKHQRDQLTKNETSNNDRTHSALPVLSFASSRAPSLFCEHFLTSPSSPPRILKFHVATKPYHFHRHIHHLRQFRLARRMQPQQAPAWNPERNETHLS